MWERRPVGTLAGPGWAWAPLWALGLGLGLCRWPVGPAAAEDAVGPHTMLRLAGMLTPEECQLFRALLEAPEPDPEQELARLSEGRRPAIEGPERRRRRRRREEPRPGPLDAEGVCRKELARWLEAEAPSLAWDRVARVLRRCGRPDVARELAKSLHQAATLELRRFAEPYRRAAAAQAAPAAPAAQAAQAAPAQPLRPRALPPPPPAWDAWETLELEKLPQAPYPRSPVGWLPALVLGFLSGFMGALGLGMLIILLMLWFTRDYRPESPSLGSRPRARPGGSRCLWEVKTLTAAASPR
ncbi:transmembrane and death domain protein 1 [Macrotis lagotis]|uniref:transmembrane and death domain protein 1 n=1 Tax=Macrotis lagotis TaxID=92651 RepID=UPI003D68CB21